MSPAFFKTRARYIQASRIRFTGWKAAPTTDNSETRSEDSTSSSWFASLSNEGARGSGVTGPAPTGQRIRGRISRLEQLPCSS